jgi:predicted negative regulator of RcsB-dependent stress response
MSSTTATTSQSVLHDALNQTEIGAFIAKHLVLFIALVAIVVFGVIGWGVYQYQQQQKTTVYAQAVHEFTQETFTKFELENISVAEFMSSYETLAAQTQYSIVLAPLAVQASDVLLSKGLWDDALKVLAPLEKHKRDPFVHFFVATRQAAAYEDLGLYAEAIRVLESLNSSSVKMMQDKVFLDLGRLYMRTGNTEKARLSFEHVTKVMAQSEFSALAHLYLNQLAK